MPRPLEIASKRLLLIESSGSFRTTLKAMLNSIGFSLIDEARPDRDGLLEMIGDGSFDIILLSHNVNDRVSGLQLLEEARFKGIMKPTASWVLMSSDASQETVLYAIESRPDEVLTKPFSLDDLRRRLYRLCQLRSALEPIDRAIERGALQRAVKLCDTLVPRGSPHYAHAQQVKGQLLVELNDYEPALKLFERYYWEKREMRHGYMMALCYYQLGQFEQAEELLSGLIKDHELLIPAYELMAKVKEARGQVVEARRWLQDAVSRSPRSLPRQMELARMATREGDLDVAEHAYRKAVELGRTSCYDSPDSYLGLANIKRQQVTGSQGHEQQQRLVEAENWLKRGAKRFRSNKAYSVRSLLLKSRLCQDLGRDKEAEGYLEEAGRLNHNLEKPLDLTREQRVVTGELQEVPLLPVLKPKPKPVQQETAPKAPARLPAQAQERMPTAAVQPAANDPQMSAKVNRIGVRNYIAGQGGQAAKYFSLAIEYDAGNVFALLNLAQLSLEVARDNPTRSEKRLLMCQRYLHLVEHRLQDPLAQAKHKRLVSLLAQPLEDLPRGSLGPLLK